LNNGARTNFFSVVLSTTMQDRNVSAERRLKKLTSLGYALQPNGTAAIPPASCGAMVTKCYRFDKYKLALWRCCDSNDFQTAKRIQGCTWRARLRYTKLTIAQTPINESDIPTIAWACLIFRQRDLWDVACLEGAVLPCRPGSDFEYERGNRPLAFGHDLCNPTASSTFRHSTPSLMSLWARNSSGHQVGPIRSNASASV
jgi:hypothetical protein